jgi:hypothetical protein
MEGKNPAATAAPRADGSHGPTPQRVTPKACLRRDAQAKPPEAAPGV